MLTEREQHEQQLGRLGRNCCGFVAGMFVAWICLQTNFLCWDLFLRSFHGTADDAKEASFKQNINMGIKQNEWNDIFSSEVTQKDCRLLKRWYMNLRVFHISGRVVAYRPMTSGMIIPRIMSGKFKQFIIFIFLFVYYCLNVCYSNGEIWYGFSLMPRCTQ